ncbi:MAG: hypothetical protein JNL58_15860 [Planctomyces sp.]|nr:hypothetical protein [Planctomyces sp.]
MQQFGPPSGGVDPAIPLMIIAAIYGCVFIIILTFRAVICYLLYRCASAIPEPYRTVSSGQAFLLLIPCFDLIWKFIYTKELSQNYRSLFNTFGQESDDCGESLGLWWSILSISTLIPFFGSIAALASLVLMFMYLVKHHECRIRALCLPVYSTPGQQVEYQK